MVRHLEQQALPTDKLFAERREDRFSMLAIDFEPAIAKHGLREDRSAATWIQNIYFDTDDQALPFNVGVRTRRYFAERQGDLQIDKGQYLLDRGVFTGFNNKAKTRKKGTISDAVRTLSQMPVSRVGDVRPYLGDQYRRRVFSGNGVRVTADFEIELFFLQQDGPVPLTRFMPRDNAQVEIKYDAEHSALADELAMALRCRGAVPSVSKRGIAYNAKRLRDVRNGQRVNGAVTELPGKEYEAKFDTTSEAPFGRFYLALNGGHVDGFMPAPATPNPFKLFSVNEYVVLPNGNRARIAFGVVENILTEKSRGSFTAGGVLQRDEAHGKNMTGTELAELSMLPVLGISRRFKKNAMLLKASAGRFYAVSFDLSLAQGREPLYQIEAEYIMSLGHGAHPRREILADIGRLGRRIEAMGLKRSTMRKEDWLVGARRA